MSEAEFNKFIRPFLAFFVDSAIGTNYVHEHSVNASSQPNNVCNHDLTEV